MKRFLFLSGLLVLLIITYSGFMTSKTSEFTEKYGAVTVFSAPT